MEEKNQELLEELSSICDELNDTNAEKLVKEFMDTLQSPDVRRSTRERKTPIGTRTF